MIFQVKVPLIGRAHPGKSIMRAKWEYVGMRADRWEGGSMSGKNITSGKGKKSKLRTAQSRPDGHTGGKILAAF